MTLRVPLTEIESRVRDGDHADARALFERALGRSPVSLPAQAFLDLGGTGEGLELLVLWARHRASRGYLAEADAYLCAALRAAHDDERRMALALRLAELRLDAGDGEGLDALVKACERHAHGTSQLLWRFVIACRHADQGMLGAAERGFALIERACGDDAGMGALLQGAQLWRAHTLAALNRLDGAEDTLRGLPATPEDDGDRRAMDGFLAARRAGAEVARWQADAPHSWLRGGEGAPARAPLPYAEGVLPSLCERARTWWGRLYNRVLLDLDQEEIDLARRRVEAARPWGMELNAPVLAARCLHIEGLVAWRSRRPSHAFAMLQRATDLYLARGVLLSAWNTARCARYALGDAEGPHVTSLSERWALTELSLRAQIEAMLDPTERVFFRINRSGSVEESLARACAHAESDAQKALHEVLGLRWFELKRPITMPSRVVKDQPSDVFTRVWQQCVLRRGISMEPIEPVRLPEDTAVLVQVVLDDRGGVFVAWRGGVKWVPAPSASRANLRRCVRRFTELWSRERGLWESEPLGEELAAALAVEGVDAALPKGVSRWWVVPDDAGYHVPWAIVPLRGKPLVMEKSVAVMPTPRHVRAPRMQGLGAANVRGFAVVDARVEGARPIPHAREDLHALERRGVVASVCERATRDELLRDLVGARCVHLACHGRFQAHAPFSSGLLLQDGWLTLADLADRSFEGVDLVVLAACWMADQALLPGRETMSVPGAFLYGGAVRVAAPLWEVIDAKNPAFMGELYRFARETDPVDALAAAQRGVVSQSPPKVWGAWQMFAGGIDAPSHLLDDTEASNKFVVH